MKQTSLLIKFLTVEDQLLDLLHQCGLDEFEAQELLGEYLYYYELSEAEGKIRQELQNDDLI